MDEGLSRAVRKVFVELYRAGLIYKDKRLVNWDPKLLTAISDLEVEQVEVKGHLGICAIRSKATATSRLHRGRHHAARDHARRHRRRRASRRRALQAISIGKNVILPLVGRRIPIVADEYSDPEKGSGAVKITPAHDFNDFEVGKRHGLPMINILDAEANSGSMAMPDFFEDVPRLSRNLNTTIRAIRRPRSLRCAQDASSRCSRRRVWSRRSSPHATLCRMATARTWSSSPSSPTNGMSTPRRWRRRLSTR